MGFCLWFLYVQHTRNTQGPRHCVRWWGGGLRSIWRDAQRHGSPLSQAFCSPEAHQQWRESQWWRSANMFISFRLTSHSNKISVYSTLKSWFSIFYVHLVPEYSLTVGCFFYYEVDLLNVFLWNTNAESYFASFTNSLSSTLLLAHEAYLLFCSIFEIHMVCSEVRSIQYVCTLCVVTIKVFYSSLWIVYGVQQIVKSSGS